ncbi:MAG: hypothetical protein COB29_09985 [Sulfitobacter sp.]|nr:MAG: hypothetical protein COB29_09985 [Sulfitobacter sp.]
MVKYYIGQPDYSGRKAQTVMTTFATASEPKLIWAGGAILGEGPVWVDREKALYWVDIKSSTIHRLDPKEKTRNSWNTQTPIGALHPASNGDFIGALKNGIHRVKLDPDAEDANLELLVDPEPTHHNNRFNDAKVGPDGALWAGSMDDLETDPTGSLYRIANDGVTTIDTAYVITNGPAFSTDGKTLYHTDTLKRTIYAFDLDTSGKASNKRVFINIPPENGHPDGMTVDTEGCLWVCHWGGWRITRYSSEGKELMYIKMPVANITSCVFGGDTHQTLFVTTASKGLSNTEKEAQPDAGGVFAIELNISGPQTLYYGEGFK